MNRDREESEYAITASREFMYWHSNKEWYSINDEKGCYELMEQAPERAKKSFELYLEKQSERK